MTSALNVQFVYNLDTDFKSCAVCHEQFEVEFQLKYHSRQSGHDNALHCAICLASFEDSYDLDRHSMKSRHATWGCGQPGCDAKSIEREYMRLHKAATHAPGHHLVFQAGALICACSAVFTNHADLQSHADATKHNPFECSCGKRYVRIDVARRHIQSFNKEADKYPCTCCKQYQGKQGFRRRDHLVQHLKVYHRLDQEKINEICPTKRSVASRQILTCPHLGCDSYRDEEFRSLPWKVQEEQRPFQKQSDFNKHMREVHQQSAFPCRVAGCERIGRKGYMREKDLMNHITKEHPEAPNYTPQATEARKYRCSRCGIPLSSLQALKDHEIFVCKERNQTD
ncbi:hypothetical protein F5Y16DRAFT_164123 [Xylariaceae sp. FL0255]|nr:hypothetical protein F5Y16DRAFT_164123 [Xylariaceae sp. FL0255]